MHYHIIARPQPRLTLPGEYAPAQVDLGDIDWDREFALVVDMGEQRTGGYAVRPRHVAPGGGGPDVQVELDVHRPGPGSMVTQAFTHPWCLVRIPRAGLGAAVQVQVRDQHGRTLATLPCRLDER